MKYGQFIYDILVVVEVFFLLLWINCCGGSILRVLLNELDVMHTNINRITWNLRKERLEFEI